MVTSAFHALHMYTPAQAAEVINCPERQVRIAARTGAVPHHRTDGRGTIRFTEEQLPALRAYLLSTSTLRAGPQILAPVEEPLSPTAQAAQMLAGVRSARR